MTARSSTTPETVDGLSARLAFLLPGIDPSARAPVVRQLEDHVRRLVKQSWARLLQACASALPVSVVDALDPAGSAMPDPDLLLARLDRLVGPAVLLCLPLAEPAGITQALLAHPDAQIREQTLDALAGGLAAGCEPLRRACMAWSRRMLVAELGRIPVLSHTDRLGLQEHLLTTGSDPSAASEDPAGVRELSDALKAAANRRATIILAERAGVALSVAEIAMVLRDPKMLVALCWKAGCDPAEVLAVQLQLGHVPPDHLLRVGPDDQWPLDASVMQWQLGILEDI